MAKPYSDDFRQKVMQAIELDGLKKCEASPLFNISRNTINLWCQRKAETGDVKPKQRKLIPMLRPGEWVIVDNATFHPGGRIAQLIEEAGCQLVYLPPYSPDLNRIEKCWATLKSRVRKLLATSDNLRDAMEIVLKEAAS